MPEPGISWPGGDGATVSCGSASCALPAQTCCIYDKDASFNVACSTGASCPVVYSNPDAGDGGDAGTASTAVALQCEIRENCPANNVCCIVKDVSGSISSHCTVACTGGAKNAELCSPTASDAGCGDAGACSSVNIGTWGLPNGFATCGGRSAL